MVQKLRNLKDYEGPTLNQTSSDTAVTIDVQLLADSVYSSARSCIKDKPRGAGSAKELALRDDLLENLSIFSDQLHQSDYKSVLVAAATIKCKLGAIQFAKNEYMAASSSFKKAFEIRRIVFGDSNFDTITAAFETGKCLHCLGNTVQALHYYKVLVKVLSSVFFQESECRRSDIVNKDSIVMIHSIAWVFHQEKSFKYASTFYRLALRIARKVLGEKHDIVARILNHFGSLYSTFKDQIQALKCFLQCLDIEKHHLGSSRTDPDSIHNFLTTLENVASTLEILGQLSSSLQCFKQAICFIESFRRGGDHDTAPVPSTRLSAMNRKRKAHILVNMARLYGKLGNSDHALDSLNRALEIQKAEFGTCHILVASALNEIGIIHGTRGDGRTAIKFFEESLEIRKTINNPDQTKTSTVLYNIAHVHHQNGNHQKALIFLEKIVDYEVTGRRGHQKLFSCSPSLLVSTFELMANMNEKLENYQAALGCLEEGICFITDADPHHVPPSLLSRFLGKAGGICLRLGYIERAMRFVIKTMRLNIAIGMPINTNIETSGVSFNIYEEQPLSAPAA